MKTTVKEKIELLENAGYKVHLKHERRYITPFNIELKVFCTNDYLSARGGLTRAIVKDEYGNIVVATSARCSNEDNYSKKVGANIALGRAIDRIDLL